MPYHATGVPVVTWLSCCFRFDCECSTSITKSHRSNAGIPSKRRLASTEISSDCVVLCGTHVCSLSFFWNSLTYFSRSPTANDLDVVCRLDISADHMYPSGGFLSMRWIVWTLSMNRTDLLTHQCSNNHRCGFLAKVIRAAPVTSKYFIGMGMIFLSAWRVWLLVQRDGGKWSLCECTSKLWWLSLRVGWFRVKVDDFGAWSPPQNIAIPSATGVWTLHHSLTTTPLFKWVFKAWISDASISAPENLIEFDSFPDSPRQNLRSLWKFHAVVSLQLDKFATDPLTCGMQFYRGTDQNNRSSTLFTKTSFDWCLFIRQSDLNVSQTASREIRQQIFIQTWLQQYCRSPFYFFAYFPINSPTCFRTVWDWRTRFSRNVVTGLA